MATKLKNLRIKKVDFVDEGANPDAHIRLFKSRSQPDAQEEEKGEKTSGILKRLADFIRKEAGMDQSEIMKGDSASFQEKFNEVKNRKIADEIRDTCYALQSSLCSILNDEEMNGEDALSAMEESLGEFQVIMQESVKNWAGGLETGIVRKDAEMTEPELEVMKAAKDRLEKFLEKASVQQKKTETMNSDQKGEEVMGMKIDKSKLTPAELAFYESIIKRCGTEESQSAAGASADTGQQETKEAEAFIAKYAAQIKARNSAQTEVTNIQQVADAEIPQASDDIYKGLHPAVKAELEELKKFREDAEDRELHEVAKRYAIIGKKTEELVPMLKGLKAAGGSAYDDMIAVLDQAVDTVEKSGIFSEIGKSGHGGCSENSAEARISSIAKGYMEKDPALSYNAAVAKAWEDNPNLMSEYEEEAGF